MIAIDTEDSRDMLLFKKWAYDALRQIGPSNLDIRESREKVCDFAFKKPCGIVSPINIFLGDENCYMHFYEYNPHVQYFKCETNNNIVISESFDEFLLSTNATNVHFAKIKYFSIPTTAEGEILINEDYLPAIVAYIEYMNIKREKNRDPRNMSSGDVMMYKTMWINELGRVKGNIKMPSILNAHTIMRRWMTMIPDMKFKKV